MGDAPRPVPAGPGTISGQESLARDFNIGLLQLTGEIRKRGLDAQRTIDRLRAALATEEALFADRDRSLDLDGGRR